MAGRLRVKNWADFQHYKDRSPPWIKLHKGLLDDYEYQRLPIASRALAPMIWLLASESADGSVDADVAKLAFRLRQSEQEIRDGLEPLIKNGFLVSDSNMLATCLQDACLETETETETETDSKKPVASAPVSQDKKSKPQAKKKTSLPEGFGISDAVRKWATENGHTNLERHLEYFVGVAKAKAYTYADWDQAFRNAIRDNWAKLDSKASDKPSFLAGAI